MQKNLLPIKKKYDLLHQVYNSQCFHFMLYVNIDLDKRILLKHFY